MKSLIVVLLGMFVLSACQLTRVEGEYKDMEIEVNSKDSKDSHGKFCPPGQAKKGNC
ncbi:MULTISPECIES: hypothetical protein [Vibrio]|uniref:Lipoprotein n=1 Tax=Vibrio proteolyticus NBRC 13287 TaxID=1219065 RepID=U2ZWP1_VIBPR|nr:MULTISPECIES: hypothetical protein [Vibrio]GAD65527.1 hypothetical protein VPR01S_01_03000 [Vibrio proteolyticus NBRC 13287]